MRVSIHFHSSFPFLIAHGTGLCVCYNNPSWEATLLMSSEQPQNPMVPTGEPHSHFLQEQVCFWSIQWCTSPIPAFPCLAAGSHCYCFMKHFLSGSCCLQQWLHQLLPHSPPDLPGAVWHSVALQISAAVVNAKFRQLSNSP